MSPSLVTLPSPLSHLTGVSGVPEGHQHALFGGPGDGHCHRDLEPAQASGSEGPADHGCQASPVSDRGGNAVGGRILWH